jgi:hypothetical protein
VHVAHGQVGALNKHRQVHPATQHTVHNSKN